VKGFLVQLPTHYSALQSVKRVRVVLRQRLATVRLASRSVNGPTAN